MKNSTKNKESNLKLHRVFLIFILLFTQTVKANNKPIENHISDYMAEQQHEQLYLLEKLVNMNSGTTNIAGVHQIGELLRPEFENLVLKFTGQKNLLTCNEQEL